MSHPDESRRMFLGKMGVVAPAIAIGSGSVVASSNQTRLQREVIGGNPNAPYSRAVSFNQMVYVAGVVGTNPSTRKLASADFEPQCRQAMENLKMSVEASGSTMGNVMKCTCFLTDVEDFTAFNRIYRSYFSSEPPARSTVVVKELVVQGAKIEIDCVTCIT